MAAGGYVFLRGADRLDVADIHVSKLTGFIGMVLDDVIGHAGIGVVVVELGGRGGIAGLFSAAAAVDDLRIGLRRAFGLRSWAGRSQDQRPVRA